jgi:hypothetical protein
MTHRTTLAGWRTLSTFACLMLAAGCASVRTGDLPADDPAARAQIEGRLYEVLAAAESKDFDRLESYHLPVVESGNRHGVRCDDGIV